MGRLPAMKPGRPRRRIVPSWLVALAVGLVVGAAGLPAAAVETPVGSKNFTAPRSVPNYFTNESGALTGAAGARGGQWRAPDYAASRAYPRSSYGYAAATHRFVHHGGHLAARSRYRHLAHGRVGAHRHFVHLALRGRRRQALHARPAAAHHRAVHPQARPSTGTKRIARAGR